MHHDHQHHDPRYVRSNRAFAIGVVLNSAFILVEFGYGAAVGSLALLADAGHNLSDVLGLLLAWGALLIARRRPSPSFTYGLRKATVLAALFSAILLLVAMGGVLWEAVGRFGHAPSVDGTAILVVASIGVVVNAVTAALFFSGREHDLNIKGAFLHMAADALVSLGVVAAGIGMLSTGWVWLDPAISIVIAVVVVLGTWGLLRDSTRLAVDAAPRGLDVGDVEARLSSHPGVVAVHDLHVWAMSTTEQALTVHLVAEDGATLDPVQLSVGLERDFGIGHCTIQVERCGSECGGSDAVCT